jgi:hypothetical protein
MTKIYKEMGTGKTIFTNDENGTASLVRISLPKEIIDELDINQNKSSSIFLLLTCAHNVVFK